ncbi:tRNA uridine(34) 5-carboxymethylaminomethyl modification radical SAM/GNAT enzyme Elp3 [Candidatus Thorarchaeota archaeon]|nr:MAG: tRNA uridine(34) 5-carboxymethylaminomethyl modification radical SAM/GNAT enzyme Elp3 [Candidatus Thorarchaeota archaeon]
MADPPDTYSLHREIIQSLLEKTQDLDKQVVNRVKNDVCGKYNLGDIPSNADILQDTVGEERETLLEVLQKRPVRTVSGVAVVATMTKPHPCPHGKCAYCPGGPDVGVPQSYTGHEPATMRGIQNDFDPYRQVIGRLAQLEATGHSTNKVELIVMGGDWCSKSNEYREEFVKGCLDGMNGKRSKNLEEAKERNETSARRNVGITFETRPDMVTPENIDDMLQFGATRVEIGVQTLSNEILEYVDRGHSTRETALATQLLRDSGLKVCYHLMPGLPGSTLKGDLEVFDKIFQDEQYRPDMLKVYPTIVVKNTKLYDWWKNGEYEPYSTEEMVALISKVVSKMPKYVRIQRMQRDIPLHQVEAGLDKGNLRELVHKRMKEEDLRNPTIRYREIGHFQMRNDTDIHPDSIKLVRRDYRASHGQEVFLSYEATELDVIFGFLRLRLPSTNAHRPELSDDTAIIRELRVYGPVVDIGDRNSDAWQHLGFGEEMVEQSEKISRDEFGVGRLAVNSGIGVKPYYRNLGFQDDGPYLVKSL